MALACLASAYGLERLLVARRRAARWRSAQVFRGAAQAAPPPHSLATGALVGHRPQHRQVAQAGEQQPQVEGARGAVRQLACIGLLLQQGAQRSGGTTVRRLFGGKGLGCESRNPLATCTQSMTKPSGAGLAAGRHARAARRQASQVFPPLPSGRRSPLAAGSAGRRPCCATGKLRRGPSGGSSCCMPAPKECRRQAQRGQPWHTGLCGSVWGHRPSVSLEQTPPYRTWLDMTSHFG